MIKKLQLLRNVGQFDSVSVPASLALERMVLFYAENGRGKTTLAAVLRSLATGDPIPVSERRRLSADHDPHVIIDCDGAATPAIFTSGAWSRTLANVAIYDDAFVDANLYSGLTVEPEHRQRLHELVLGSQGVALHRKIAEYASKIEAHNAELRKLEQKVPAGELHGVPFEKFCALPVIPEVDVAIVETERRIAASRAQDPIRQARAFDSITLPSFDVEALRDLLGQGVPDLDTAAAERVKKHLKALGRTGEAWLSTGLGFAAPKDGSTEGSCPFCLQDLSASSILGHYRAYFSTAYDDLKTSIADALATAKRVHAGDVPAAFERAVRVAVERRQFWSQFCETPEFSLDTAEIVRVWRDARDAVVAELQAKQAAPLDPRPVPEAVVAAIATHEALRTQVAAASAELTAANAAIELVKEQAAAGGTAALEADCARLRASRARHLPAIAKHCEDYQRENEAKTRTAALRDEARDKLAAYRSAVFPTYQQAVNQYLQRFNAGFRIDSVVSVNTRKGTSCNYNVIIDSTPVPVAGGTPEVGEPSFRNTLSAGDRNTLALAFFLASLDQDPNLGSKVVVIDDPISSLDEHRAMTTVHEIRRLAQRAGQVIVLSHDKRFLARIWDHGKAKSTAIQIVRNGLGSTLTAWNVKNDADTEYDRRHALLREYLGSSKANAREVAEAIRPVLEGFLRVARPAEFPQSTLLGQFLDVCKQRVGKDSEVLDAGTIQNVDEIREYANRFHHDTNPAWETETINDGELHGFVGKTLSFVRR